MAAVLPPPPPFVPAGKLAEGDAPAARALFNTVFKWEVAVQPDVTDAYGDPIGPLLAVAETGPEQQAVLVALRDDKL